MRRSRLATSIAAPFTALALGLVLASAFAIPVAAKEGMMAVLDAPIALDTPPGTELLVGVRVTVLTDQGERPVDGSPIVLILTGPSGNTTEAAGEVRSKTETNHYLMRITVPDGGVRKAQVVIRGSSSGGTRVDLDIPFTADPFTFGGVTAHTAQVAPAATPGLTPFPRVSAAALPPATVAPAAATVAPASAVAPVAGDAAVVETGSPAGPAGTSETAWWPAPLALVLLGVAVVIAIRIRTARPSAPGA